MSEGGIELRVRAGTRRVKKAYIHSRLVFKGLRRCNLSLVLCKKLRDILIPNMSRKGKECEKTEKKMGKKKE